MTADGVQRLDLKDLDALLVRAKEEGWTELALLGLWRPGTLAQQLADKLIREGWSADRVFLFNEELDRMPPTLASLTGLNSLDLWGHQIGDEGAKAIASLTGLTWLDLANNRIGVEGAKAIASLTRLTSLDLAGNQIGDEGAKAVASLTRLTSLDLAGNQIGDEGAKAVASLSGLTWLHLGSNRIGDAGVGALANLSSLQFLDLYANEISAHGARELSKLPKLTSLNLGLNNRGIGDTGAEALGQSLRLVSLNVGSNLIGDAGAIALARLPRLAVLNLSANSISPAGARAVLDAWSDPATCERRRFLDLRENGYLGALLPVEVLQQTDAQALIAAWRRFREAEVQQEPLPPAEAAGEPVAHGVQVGTAPDGRLTLVDPALGVGARDDDVGRELHAEVIAALDRLIARARQSNAVAEWREAAEAAKERLGNGPREVRVSAILRIERLRSLRQADERRKSEPDPLVEPAEAGVAAALRDAVAAANLYIETDPYLGEQQRGLADPGLDLAISTEEAESAEAEMEELDIADPALLAELQVGRETAEAGGRTGARALAWLAGSWRNVVREMLRQVLAWMREQVKAVRASAGDAAMQGRIGTSITIEEAATWLTSIELRAGNARSAVASAGAEGLRTAGHAFATQVGKRAGDITVMGMVAFLTCQFALLTRLGWPADLRALLARLLGL